jgi:hypothetical protein
MNIERTDKEIIIRLPSSMDIEEVQKMIDYLRFREITSKSKASQKDIDKLVSDVKMERKPRTILKPKAKA